LISGRTTGDCLMARMSAITSSGSTHSGCSNWLQPNIFRPRGFDASFQARPLGLHHPNPGAHARHYGGLAQV
jgi:hypothetical protein